MRAGICILMAAGVAAAFIATFGWLRWRDQRRRDGDRIVLRLRFPHDLAFDAVLAFARSLASLVPSRDLLGGASSVVFETLATAGGIEHYLRIPRHRAAVVLAQLRTACPAVETETGPDPHSHYASATELRLLDHERALRTDQPEAVAAAVLASLSSLNAGERLSLQWVARPIAGMRPNSRWVASLAGAIGLAAHEEKPTKEQRDKQAEPLFLAAGRVAASAQTKQRSEALARRVPAVLHLVHRPGGAAFVRRHLPSRLVRRRVTRGSAPLFEVPVTLNASELAELIAWPMGAPRVEGLELVRSRRLPASKQAPNAGRVLGISSADPSRNIALSAADSLHHVHLIGPTGVGKSTLLANLVVQDLRRGSGIVLIDPKGDLVSTVLDRVPEERQDDVIVVDLTDDAWPVGLNLLAGAERSPERVADEILGIFHRLYAAFWGPRTQDILHASLLTLAQAAGMTLGELPLLLTNDGFRRRLVGVLDDPIALGPFWAWYEQLSPAERASAIGPVMNKLRAFLMRRRLRNVLGQVTPTWTMDEVLNHRRVLLVNLGRGELGAETAELVGSLVVAQLWQAIQRRALRLPVFVTIDEFQDVINLPTDLGEVLAQARGFGVGVTLAHQHLGQLDAKLRQAVLANARTKVVFQAGADDASVLARQLGGGLEARDLMQLPRYEAYVAACVGGEVMSPASLRTNPLVPAAGSGDAVRERSREQFARPRAEVEADILARHGATPSDGEITVGRQRRRAS